MSHSHPYDAIRSADSMPTSASQPQLRRIRDSARPLPWPATKIERDVLHELWRESRATGQPITAIVKQAVDAYLTAKLEAPDADLAVPTRAEERPAA